MSSGKTLRHTAILLLMATVLCALAGTRLTGRPITKDAAATLHMAINLEHHGVMSVAESPPYPATMEREPLPVLTEAATIWAIDAIKGPASPEAYLSGERARDLKLPNLLWLAALMMAAASAVRHFRGSTGWQVTAMVLVALPFTFLITKPERSIIGVDCLTTELPGAALLLSASLVLARGFLVSSARWLLLASLLFGALALTKAAVFYVYLVTVALLAVASLFYMRRGVWTRQRAVAVFVVLLVPFVLMTGGWIYRNHRQLGYFQLTQRSGPILLYRGMLGGMTRTEYAGSFFAWSSWPIQATVGRFTGFSSADLTADGRLRRLPLVLPGKDGVRDEQAEESGRPQDAVTWYRKSRAIYTEDVRRLAAAGARDPEAGADSATGREGIRLMERRPFMQLALVLPMLWAGAALTFPLLVLAIGWSWRSRAPGLALYALPALGIVLFYAMFTQFDARYGWLPRPIATVALVVMAARLCNRYLYRAHQGDDLAADNAGRLITPTEVSDLAGG